MPDMKFKFTIQPYQTEAVESVVKVFEGQPNEKFPYRRDVEVSRTLENWQVPEEELAMGYANAKIDASVNVLENIHKSLFSILPRELKHGMM